LLFFIAKKVSFDSKKEADLYFFYHCEIGFVCHLRLRGEKMRFTIKDIASKANVSVSTVSKCLNGYGDVGPETKKHVLETVEQMNYVPNTFARYISHKNTNVIGLTVPDIKDPYFAQSAYGIETKLGEMGYQLFLGNLDRNEQKFLDFTKQAREMRFDGLIFTTDWWSPKVKEALSRLDIPVLSLRRRTPQELSIPYIDSDHYAGALVMMDYLYGKGHRNIAHVKLPNESGEFRESAYKRFCTEKGIEERFISVDMPANILSDAVKNGSEACIRILTQWPDTTAIFAGSDFIAVGVMAELKKQGIRVPEDISVVGIGNVEYSRLPWFSLTTMELFRYEMGIKAAQMLLEEISGKKVENNLFQANLVERESVQSRI